MLDQRAQTHLAVRVQKVVAGTGFDAKQQILYRIAQGRFTRLVRANNQVKILPGPRQRNRFVGKFSVAQQIKTCNAHDSLSSISPDKPTGQA
ncbi:MAG: hypothetical protein ACD_23C01013G0002 [uncultured bacterium]|nr:MAG: hypothetical protein ACD_23C01013G0002 [uncultured bacterium]